MGNLISVGCASQKGTGVPGTCVTSLLRWNRSRKFYGRS
jgi:hypothetical protein